MMDEEKVEETVKEEVEKKVGAKDSMIFVTEKDTFDIDIECYKDEDKMFVKGEDEEYDESKTVETITMTFKYPNQGDGVLINRGSQLDTRGEGIDVNDFLQLEFNRMSVLIRKWTLGEPVDNEHVLNLHPKVVKGILAQLRDKIELDGLM